MVDEGFKGYFHENTVILFLSSETLKTEGKAKKLEGHKKYSSETAEAVNFPNFTAKSKGFSLQEQLRALDPPPGDEKMY